MPSSVPVICPWIVPQAPAELLALFGAEPETESFPPRHGLQSDVRETRTIRRVDAGLLSQGVTNFLLNKPLAMNLYPAGTMPGFLNLFTGVPTPRVLKTITASTVTTMPKDAYRERLSADRELLIRYAEYAELASKSELIGKEALFTLPLADRVLLWFASALLYEGVNPLDVTDDTVPVAIPITRAALANIIYTSKGPLDHLMAEFYRTETLVRTDAGMRVRVRALRPMAEWVLTH